MMRIQTYEVLTDEQMASVATEMIRYAEAVPFVRDAALAQLKQPGTTTEQHGPMMRVRGSSLGVLENYTRFVAVDKDYPCQVSLIIERAPELHYKQLNIVESLGKALPPRIVAQIAQHFFDDPDSIHVMDTPKHVCVMVQALDEEEKSICAN